MLLLKTVSLLFIPLDLMNGNYQASIHFTSNCFDLLFSSRLVGVFYLISCKEIYFWW